MCRGPYPATTTVRPLLLLRVLRGGDASVIVARWMIHCRIIIEPPPRGRSPCRLGHALLLAERVPLLCSSLLVALFEIAAASSANTQTNNGGEQRHSDACKDACVVPCRAAASGVVVLRLVVGHDPLESDKKIGPSSYSSVTFAT